MQVSIFTWVMLLAGLGLVGVTAKRRNRK